MLILLVLGQLWKLTKNTRKKEFCTKEEKHFVRVGRCLEVFSEFAFFVPFSSFGKSHLQ